MRITRNPSGEAGAEFRLTAQSINVCVPLIANTITFASSIGTDLMTIAFVPCLQSSSTSVSLSLPVGFMYTCSEYWAAMDSRRKVSKNLEGIREMLKRKK
jgi:hypothetical protein